MIKNNLSKIMGEKRLKMSELQRLSGLSESTISRIYHNTTGTISYDTLDKLCIALDCNTQDILEFVKNE